MITLNVLESVRDDQLTFEDSARKIYRFVNSDSCKESDSDAASNSDEVFLPKNKLRQV